MGLLPCSYIVAIWSSPHHHIFFSDLSRGICLLYLLCVTPFVGVVLNVAKLLPFLECMPDIFRTVKLSIFSMFANTANGVVVYQNSGRGGLYVNTGACVSVMGRVYNHRAMGAICKQRGRQELQVPRRGRRKVCVPRRKAGRRQGKRKSLGLQREQRMKSRHRRREWRDEGTGLRGTELSATEQESRVVGGLKRGARSPTLGKSDLVAVAVPSQSCCLYDIASTRARVSCSTVRTKCSTARTYTWTIIKVAQLCVTSSLLWNFLTANLQACYPLHSCVKHRIYLQYTVTCARYPHHDISNLSCSAHIQSLHFTLAQVYVNSIYYNWQYMQL